MVAEMTGGYNLIVPMMVVSSLSYLLLGRVSLYEKQVPTRVDSPAHIGDFAVDIMDRLTVRNAVAQNRKVEAIPESMPFGQVLRIVLASDQQDFPVVDKEENLSGIISMTDLRRAMADKEVQALLLAKDIAMGGVRTITMDDTLNTALSLMAILDVRELPVVSKDDPRKVISLVSRKDITRAYHEEVERAKNPSAPPADAGGGPVI
jgi:CIC family chloride channel protein